MSLTDLSKRIGKQIQVSQATYVVVANIGEHLQKVEERRSNERLDQLEAEVDRRSEEQTRHNQLIDAINALNKNSGSSSGSDNNKTGSGLLSGLGLGLAGKAIGFGAGIGALGLGIGAFFSGLALADTASSWMNTDMSHLKKQMVTLGEALSEMPEDGFARFAGLLAAGGAFGALFGVGKSGKAAVGMGAIGLGIGAFFGGLAVGDAAGAWMQTDGAALKSMMINLGEGLAAFSGDNLVTLGALLGAGALFGPVAGAKAATGMGLIGLGLGAFFAGIGAGSKVISMMGADGSGIRDLMVNTATGLSALAEVDYSNLLLFGGAATSIGLGMAALFGAKGLGALGNIVEGISGFFGKDDKSIFERIADELKVLETVDYSIVEKLNPLSKAFSNLASSIGAMNDADMSNIKENIKELADTVEWAIPLLNHMWQGGRMGQGYFDGYSDRDFGQGLQNVPVEQMSQKLIGISSMAGYRVNQSGVNLTNQTAELDQVRTAASNIIVSAPNNVQNVSSSRSTLSLGGGVSVTDSFDTGTR